MEGFKTHAHILYDLFHGGIDLLNTPSEGAFIAQNYHFAENISVDYALMEKSEHIFLIPARFDLDDLGSWKSIYDRQPKDVIKNAEISAKLYSETATRNLVKTDSN